MDYRISNVPTDINACDCKRGCADTVRESKLKVGSARKIPCRLGESNLRQRCAGPMFYQLSYIHLTFDYLLHKDQNHAANEIHIE